MSQPTYQDLLNSGMDIRRTIASSGKNGLKSFTKDHAATRSKNSAKAYKSIKKSK